MGTVAKALSLLTHFNQTRLEMGLSDITRASGMNKATVFRLMGELQACGFVEQVGNDRAYRLGPEVLRLAALREKAVPILSVSRDVLKDLCDLTGETSHLSILRGRELTSLIHEYSPRHATRVMMEDAEVLSLHATASGLAVLAYSDAEFVDEFLATPLVGHTKRTETNPEKLRQVLSNARANGVAESANAFELDVHSLAAPIFDAEQNPAGAIAVAAPASRMTPQKRDRIAEAVKEAALELTQKIGGFCPADYPQERAA
ncbi:IclR family transcriptional regulator [Lutimaribacter marinistellae]|uniref:IclR family transcriptional regulator n=1 Tax=Lutimaribacter marinistellae TaxID=1820329 RepID=A0ABV7TFM7_9RHOB